MSETDGGHIPTEWETLSDEEKARRVRETATMEPEDVIVGDDGGRASKETVDPTTLDWRRVWDDYECFDGYKPIGPTKLALALDAHREITTGMPPNEAVKVAVKNGQLDQRGNRLVPAGGGL